LAVREGRRGGGVGERRRRVRVGRVMERKLCACGLWVAVCGGDRVRWPVGCDLWAVMCGGEVACGPAGWMAIAPAC